MSWVQLEADIDRLEGSGIVLVGLMIVLISGHDLLGVLWLEGFAVLPTS